MTQRQKDKLSWLLADLCAASIKLGKVRKDFCPLWKARGEEQDKAFNHVMCYVDEIVN